MLSTYVLFCINNDNYYPDFFTQGFLLIFGNTWTNRVHVTDVTHDIEVGEILMEVMVQIDVHYVMTEKMKQPTLISTLFQN